MKYISYGRQFIDKRDKKLVLSSLTKDLITTGPFVKKFEDKLKKITLAYSQLKKTLGKK